jgi:molybdenum cofactor cytidylyltransferase
MGRPKASLTMGPKGPTFVEAISRTLDGAGIRAVRIVVAPGSPPGGGVVNPDPDGGMLSSVQCGLRAFRRDLRAVLLWPVDHPLVSQSTVTAIVGAWSTSAAPIVVPSYGGKRGHPALFASRVIPELFSVDPTRGARAVVRAHPDTLELPVEDPGIVADIDTPEDYARYFHTSVASLPEAP